MTIIITGINGFLGSNIATSLKQNYSVVGISKTSTFAKGINTYTSDEIDLIKIVPDIVIMCHAAVSSGNYFCDIKTLFNSNVLLTETLVNKFPTAKHIYISSASIYSNTNNILDENSNINPLNDYAISKYWGEKISQKVSKSVIVRLSSLYGLGMKDNTLIPNYVNQAIQSNIIEVWGSGERKQNYFHVTDAVELIQAIINTGSWNKEIYLGVYKHEYSNIEIAKIISSETNAEIVFKNTDTSQSVHFDNTSTRNCLNWAPVTSISTGLKQYIEWKRKQS